jgi:hypothetical protein
MPFDHSKPTFAMRHMPEP